MPTPLSPTRIDDVSRRVCRTDFAAPGFDLLDLGPVDSRAVRATMKRIADALSARHGEPLRFRSLSRFDQQVTTKFHLDGGPAESLLVLGYEPSPVRGRLSMADYSRCAVERGMTPAEFLKRLNPMLPPGAEALRPYITELPVVDPTHAFILVVNNSSRAPGAGWLGVLHRGEIPHPDPSARRVINSAMLVPASLADADAADDATAAEFLATDAISSR